MTSCKQSPARPASLGRWPGGRLFTTLRASVLCSALQTFRALRSMFATLHAGIGVKQTHSYARSLEILSCGSSDLNTKLIELRKWIDIALKYEHGRCRGLLYSLLGSSFCWSENQIQSDDAVKYWKRGARLGDVAAMGELAVAYGRGWGVCKDLRRSLSYFRRVIKNAPFEKRKVVLEVEKICAEGNDLKGALWKAEMRAFLQKLRTSGRSMSNTDQGLLI